MSKKKKTSFWQAADNAAQQAAALPAWKQKGGSIFPDSRTTPKDSDKPELLSLEEIEAIKQVWWADGIECVEDDDPESIPRLIATAKAAYYLSARNAQLEAVVEAAKCLGDRWPHGCSDHNCIIQKPQGMGTNSGCMCRKDLQHLVRTLRTL